MKKVFLILSMIALSSVAAFSQNYVFVNTDTVFRSIPELNAAVEEIDAFAQEQQAVIDEAYAMIEDMFNDYMANRDSMSEQQRNQTEAQLMDNENRVIEFQESIFGQDGELMRMRTEKIQPIQQNVLNVIARFASDNNLGMVIDVATNPMVIYYSPSLDKTEEIIRLLQ